MQAFSAKDSISKLSLMVLAALGFVILDMWAGGIFGDPPKPGREWLGWISASFFALLGAIGLRRLLNPTEQIRITSDGICYRQWSNDTIPWREIVTVAVWQFKGQKSILLSLRDPGRFPSTTFLGKMAAANHALTGGDIALTLTSLTRVLRMRCRQLSISCPNKTESGGAGERYDPHHPRQAPDQAGLYPQADGICEGRKLMKERPNG